MPNDETGVRLQALLLADHANVREGLLSVLSAGITRVGLGTYPGHLPAYLVMVIYLPPDQVPLAHEGEVKLKYPETATEIATVKMGFQATAETYPGEGLYLPLVMPIHNIPFEKTGQVDLQVSLNNQHAGELSFWLLAGPLGA